MERIQSISGGKGVRPPASDRNHPVLGSQSPSPENCPAVHRAAQPQHSGPAAAFAAGGAMTLLIPYFPWRFDMPDPGTFAVIAGVLLFCGWRLCRRS